MADSIDEVGLEITKKGPRYIYDVNLDASNRYAKITEGLAPVSPQEATSAVSSAQILSQKPIYGTQLIENIEYLEMPRGFAFWAQIEPPANYYEQRPLVGAQGNLLFSNISSEHLKACIDKLALPLEQLATTIGETREYAFAWEKVKEEELMAKELTILRESFKEFHHLSEIAESIHQLRNQFQQG